MNPSSRFVVALHALSAMTLSATYRRVPWVTSDFLASSVNTNPVVVRRILSRLREADIIESQAGPQGGSRLLSNPDVLTLLDIYQAVEDEGLFHLHYADPNPHCPVGCNIQKVLTSTLDKAETAMKTSLEATTLTQIIEQLRPAVEEFLATHPEYA